jgi:hypothetical protein
MIQKIENLDELNSLLQLNLDNNLIKYVQNLSHLESLNFLSV